MADFKVVGSSVPRAEGADKVIGRTLYAADVALPGTLWGKILRSPYPHARILRMNTANAHKVPGVKAIVTGEDTRGLYIGKQIRDMPVLCWDTVRFVGDRVAAVAADTETTRCRIALPIGATSVGGLFIFPAYRPLGSRSCGSRP